MKYYPERIKVIFCAPKYARTPYNFCVRRLVQVLLCLTFAATLHASVPGTVVRFNRSSAEAHLDDSTAKRKLALTAAPADTISFYLEFYGTEQLPAKVQHKGGLLHWFTSTVKKTAQKVAFFSN
jgi:hypothetical protein